MPGTTPKNLQDQLKALADWANNVSAELPKQIPEFDKVKDKDVPAEAWNWLKKRAEEDPFQRVLAATGRTEALAELKPGESSTIQLEDFLERMSSAMVTAQSQLDSESLRYLQKTAGDAHVLPSIFRVPKLNAQMRFALDVQDTSTLNLIFYKRDEKTSSRNEQAIDFDVVSVPAPPDAAARVKALAPRLDLVLDPFERGRVIQALTGDAAGDPDIRRIAAAAPNRIVILSAGVEYLVMAAEAAKDNQVGTTRVTLPAAGSPTVVPIYKFSSAAGNQVAYRNLILSIADAQEKFLSGR